MINKYIFNKKLFFYFFLIYGTYFFLTSATYALRDGLLPSYGGDVVGLYNLYKFGYEIKFNGFGILDYLSKLMVSKFSSPIISVLFLIYLPILVNIASGLYIRRKLVNEYKLDSDLSWLLLSFIVFEPLTFALQLSGHTLYIPLLPLAISLFFQYANIFSNLIGLFILALVNPYLIPGFFIYSIFIDFQSKNKKRLFFYFLMVILLLLKILIEYSLDFKIADLFGFDIKNRMNASGVFPLNFIMPDINSFLGTFTLEFKNKYYTYLNVPEANYSCLIFLAIIFLYFKRRKICYLKVIFYFFLLLIMLCFPPQTRLIPNFYFPTYLYNLALPELRIISRNFSYIYIVFTIILFKLSTQYFKPKDRLFLVLFIVLFFPFNIPYIKMDKLSYFECKDQEHRRNSFLKNLDSSSWDRYYSNYFNKEVFTFPVLDSSHNIKYCLYE